MNSFPGSSFILPGVFAVFVAATVLGALIAVSSARVIRSVCGLALCSIGLAGLYYFLQSPFLALMQILIYVGAVCVTIIFAIMLAEPRETARRRKRFNLFLWTGYTLLTGRSRNGAVARRLKRFLWTACAPLVGVAIFTGLCRLGLEEKWTAPASRVSDGSVKAIGVSLLTTYSLPFELISLVLLVAILGALVIARGGRTQA